MKYLVFLLWVISCSQCFSEASKILAIMPLHAKSHYVPFEPLLKRLAERGHEVRVVSHFPQKVKIPNLTDVDISASLPPRIGSMDLGVVENFTLWTNAKYLWKNGVGICRPVFEHPGVKELLDTKERFDLTIFEIFGTDCFLGFAEKFGTPFVGVTSSIAMPWLPDALSNPDNPSYIPHFFSRYPGHMSFHERLLNAVYLLALKIGYRFYSDQPSYEIAKSYFGPNLPPLDVLRSKVGLVLVNGHHSVTSPRAMAPGVKEVGGIHIPSSGPARLPRELKEYLDSAVEGVVYFSIGSVLNSTTFPPKNLAILREAFGQLPHRVLWKCDEREMPQLPRNVKCFDWVPQLSVLCHPNVRVFFSHGGLLSTQEAVYCGVPILGMPIHGDQFANVAHSVEQGYALMTDFYNPSHDNIYGNLKALLTDNRYTEHVRQASRRFRDRPQAPLEEAVFWVEYILRHGPRALRTAASELAWYQYLLLDVVAGVLFGLVFFFWILNKLLCAIFRRRKCPVEDKKKKN
ncbi:UDP-glucosyltransferase 2-like [Neodiprion virginianus]|uniref:UDP-glucosyltransferase 2-like n=1 Tax=Neodiprion virginianus TaxID=2961670 RepID=UPI001EE6969E|nr:UDP-glucosyltransferase 2-like [Neodiprion virginianus]